MNVLEQAILKIADAKAVAVLVKGITNPFFANMIKVIESECKGKRYSMELIHVEACEDEVAVAQKAVREKRLRGIIFLGGIFAHSDEKLKKLNVPFVFSTVGSTPESIGRHLYSSISVDDRRESSRMVDYLISLGHTRIAILVADAAAEQSVGKLRLKGYYDALGAHGIEPDESLVFPTDGSMGHFSIESGYITTKKLLEGGAEFTALYAISDTLAIGALRALHEAGYNVPRDVSIAGYDGIDMANYMVPSLTTMRQPVEAIAKETAEVLFDIIAGKAAHRHVTYEAELLVRESAGRACKEN